ncbi:ornithine--oxo-acid transaminase [Rarobacter faecitabidus]|uniref:ornithine aminotransferase n=1 Tax=Rarobacter faecitabidus TaxID=13243 RepID=A0A542ZA73_RARFA|nr:ornithine--oxo-acid transaminase [Rarobacter faecitabidus]
MADSTATQQSAMPAAQEGASRLAHNYHPLPVTLTSGKGAWVTDSQGREYLDCLSAYSAVNFGHANPELLAVAHAQLDRLTLTSRAFDNDRLDEFALALTNLTGTDMVLPMNTGAEAVESAIKVARAWGYRVRGVPENQANIIVMDGNFHGRTTTIVGFSDDPSAYRDFGPFTPGFRSVPYGDALAIAQAMDENTVAVLIEPIQGEAGVLIPPAGYLADVRELTAARNVLLICDEVQAGLGRTGATLESERQGVQADLMTLGKALGGGVVPVSAVVGRGDILGVLRPGEHGSTFGGNPLAAAVGTQVVRMLETGEHQRAARERGAQLRAALDPLVGNGLTAIRSAGLWFGIDVDPALGTGRDVCMRLMERSVLAKDTHGQTVRLAPPLIVTPAEVERLADAVTTALRA